MSIRILSVEDHPVFREGLNTIIASQPDMQLVAQASNGAEGTRERAERIGGNLLIASSPDSGTEVTIVVPAGIAFGQPHRTLHSD